MTGTRAGQRRDRTTAWAARSLPLAQWPGAERSAWEHARRPGRKLVPGGPASRLGEETCKDLVRRYGQFLNYCRRTGRLDGSAEAGALVTPIAVAGFIAELQARVRSVTVAQSVYKICRTARLIAPPRDFSWLSEIARDLMLVAEPMNKSARVVKTERLVEAGLALVCEAELATSRSPLARALLARNGLMIAMLALCPIRLKNFAALEIGQSIVEQEGIWWIVLRKTKSRRPDERPIPDYLNAAIQQYVEVYRPTLIGANGGKLRNLGVSQCAITNCNRALWIGRTGNSLSRVQVWRNLRESTRATIGVDVSPHLFRASAATTAAVHADGMPNLASALLHHTDPSVTDDHYNRANSLSVAEHFARLVRNL